MAKSVLCSVQGTASGFTHKAKARRHTGIQIISGPASMEEACSSSGIGSSSSNNSTHQSSAGASAVTMGPKDAGEAAVRRVHEMVKTVAAVHRDTGGRKLRSSIDQLAKQLAAEAVGSRTPPVLLGR